MADSSVPDFLTHYYERTGGPFRSFSMLAPEEADALQAALRTRGDVFASQRAEDYLANRRELEQRVRDLFIAKGGNPRRARPHYLILGANPWLLGWYREGCELRLPLRDFDPATVSFTYGDTFPAMRYNDGLATRGQVYTLAELPALVAEFGLPQIVNPDGARSPALHRGPTVGRRADPGLSGRRPEARHIGHGQNGWNTDEHGCGARAVAARAWACLAGGNAPRGTPSSQATPRRGPIQWVAPPQSSPEPPRRIIHR